MRGLLIFLGAALLAGPVAAQDWRMAPEYDVQLSSYDIQPSEMRLKAGEPVRLRFVNNSNKGLSFSAKDFFKASQLRRRDGETIEDGTIEVPPLSTRTVVLVPKAGRYKVSGGNFLHRLLGMSGRIIVE
ncbi:MAG TPA: cupredoxin domain-containing protein [Allosphingosinicella sp.]|jgi:plastocyanin